VDYIAQGEVGDEALDFGSVRTFADQDVASVGELGASLCDGLEEDIWTFVVGQSSDPTDEKASWNGQMAKRRFGVGEGAKVDAVADEVDARGGNAGVEEALANVFGDSYDSCVVAQNETVDGTVEPEEEVVVVPGVTGRDERNGGLAHGEVGVNVCLVAVSVDYVWVGCGCERSDAGWNRAVELAVAGDHVGFDAFGQSAFVELEIGIGGVGEDTDQAYVTLFVEGSGEVEDDCFGTVHSAAGDDVEDPHRSLAGAGSGSDS